MSKPLNNPTYTELMASLEPAPKDQKVTGTLIAQGTDSAIIRTPEGNTVLTDRNGNRRSQ